MRIFYVPPHKIFSLHSVPWHKRSSVVFTPEAEQDNDKTNVEPVHSYSHQVHNGAGGGGGHRRQAQVCLPK